MAAPASAADLAARPYTKARPPMVAAIYDWSGFYIGANDGWGSSHKCWDITNFLGATVVPAFREGCHDATGGVVGGQSGYRWQSAGWVFGLEAQGDWADLKGSNVSVFIPNWTNNSKIEAFGLFTGQVGYAWNNVLWYVKGGAAVTDDKYRGTVTATGALFDSASETRWGGVVGPASNSDSHRIGRLRSSTITCSWVTIVATSRRQVFWVPLSYRSAGYSARTLSAKMWTSSPLASTTASTGVVRLSGSTDFLETPATQAPASPGLFVLAWRNYRSCGCRGWVKLRRTQYEQISSGSPAPDKRTIPEPVKWHTFGTLPRAPTAIIVGMTWPPTTRRSEALMQVE
jgi:hypothetical protein